MIGYNPQGKKRPIERIDRNLKLLLVTSDHPAGPEDTPRSSPASDTPMAPRSPLLNPSKTFPLIAAPAMEAPAVVALPPPPVPPVASAAATVAAALERFLHGSRYCRSPEHSTLITVQVCALAPARGLTIKNEEVRQQQHLTTTKTYHLLDADFTIVPRMLSLLDADFATVVNKKR